MPRTILVHLNVELPDGYPYDQLPVDELVKEIEGALEVGTDPASASHLRLTGFAISKPRRHTEQPYPQRDGPALVPEHGADARPRPREIPVTLQTPAGNLVFNDFAIVVALAEEI